MNCFLNHGAQCGDGCEAYLGDSRPSCVILRLLLAMSKYLDSARQKKNPEVKYPAGPPAPEVR